MKIRKLLLIFWLFIIFSGIAFLFWHNEWKYSLPTPVPEDYRPVSTGERVNISNKITFSNKPVFLHFFNPECPCSRFNMTHFKSLVKEYGNRVNFFVIVMNEDTDYTAEEIRDKYDIDLPVLFDRSIADACGVYSTPQAAIINTDHKLYYRGNYNKSRYCIDKNTNYAQMAIHSLVNYRDKPIFNQLALRSYGCELPYCEK